MEVKNLNKDGIHYTVFLPQKTVKRALIAIHGFAGDSQSSAIYEVAKSITQKDYAVIAFDLPAHGEDEKRICTIADCFAYLDKVVDYVCNQYTADISFFATSFGGYLLLNYLNKTNHKFKNVILRAPAVFMDSILLHKILPMHGYSASDLNNGSVNLGFERELNIGKAFYDDLVKHRLHKPNNSYDYNIIQGKKDDVVDYKQNDKFFRKNAMKYHFYYLDNADHRFKNPGELQEIVKITESILFNK